MGGQAAALSAGLLPSQQPLGPTDVLSTNYVPGSHEAADKGEPRALPQWVGSRCTRQRNTTVSAGGRSAEGISCPEFSLSLHFSDLLHISTCVSARHFNLSGTYPQLCSNPCHSQPPSRQVPRSRQSCVHCSPTWPVAVLCTHCACTAPNSGPGTSPAPCYGQSCLLVSLGPPCSTHSQRVPTCLLILKSHQVPPHFQTLPLPPLLTEF